MDVNNIIFSLRGEQVGSIEVTSPKILDVYIAKWKSEKGLPLEVEETVFDKKLNKKVTQKVQKAREEITLEKITERGLSYMAALVIETEGLSKKKLKIKIKSGKRKVLTDVDTAIEFINYEDIKVVTDASKYKDIKTKSEFEIEVDNLADKELYSNADDFKDKAVLRLMLNQKATDLSFDLAKLINEDEDKTAFVYVEVTSVESNIVYCGEGENNNNFMYGEDKWFKIKYLEQPWIIKAREEYEKKINQTDNCQYIVDTYHAVNREHKPKSCSDHWCASFVGWCLKETGYSAQLDPGAAAYGNILTRYRNKIQTTIDKDGKTVPLTEKNAAGKTVYVTKDVFEDPIWAQKLSKMFLGCICHVKPLGYNHVTFAVAIDYKGNYLFLGGNQSNSVRLANYPNSIQARIYPIEYEIEDTDDEFPIYYVDVPKNGSVTAS